MSRLIFKPWQQGLYFSPFVKLWVNYGLSYSEIKDMPIRTALRTKTIAISNGAEVIGSPQLTAEEFTNNFKLVEKWI
ncbi:hypothetical protein B620_gp44 [Croceibacter phage P2559S]|uniref:hypothetical protein n=1 Tax=Croceibacter phage P2559S TaxID=1176422 RepID=UPI0002688EC7|nr:hypothetical protein B620_gp44 [Croceibacter phage P2559S]AFM54822.1 hypothetical protein P2559S_44 [Croceibacter phage P2559S]